MCFVCVPAACGCRGEAQLWRQPSEKEERVDSASEASE